MWKRVLDTYNEIQPGLHSEAKEKANFRRKWEAEAREAQRELTVQEPDQVWRNWDSVGDLIDFNDLGVDFDYVRDPQLCWNEDANGNATKTADAFLGKPLNSYRRSARLRDKRS